MDTFKLICKCGKKIDTTHCEAGDNDSEYYECKCGTTYNIIVGDINE
jgi:lysyl-tRNA synthetase class I